MANLKKYINFVINWEGNGTDTQLVVSFAHDPVCLIPDSGVVSAAFSAAHPLPGSVSGVTASGGTISGTPSYNSVTGDLTVTFSPAPTVGTLGNLKGQAEYA